jgi:serine/threonine protein kinase
MGHAREQNDAFEFKWAGEGANQVRHHAQRGRAKPKNVSFTPFWFSTGARRSPLRTLTLFQSLEEEHLVKSGFADVSKLVRLLQWKSWRNLRWFKNQVAHVKAEREVLVKAKNPWIMDLKFSFQDEKYLYLVMDFLPGGDLMTLLIRKDVLYED